ncbi:DUF2690 domain-containing protein [Kitasatospora sp. NPDC058218]|uniref:helix-turn-helix domain-containing protein n=1 Tax=Kitasatospora sp. NPDC058218 TaxID=3346385 RepID=UPI0036DDE4CF
MGSAWKQLPDDLSVPAKLLTEELRAVKDATGLSLSELASRTHYSRASWERWLNGKRIITEQALDALTKAVECDGPTLRALWEQTVAGAEDAAGAVQGAAGPDAAAGVAGVELDAADVEPGAAGVEPAAPEGETAEADDAQPAAGDGPDRTATVRWWRRPVALVCCAAVTAALVVLAGVRYSRDGGTEPTAVAQPAVSGTATTTSRTAPATPSCQAMGCSHKDPKATGCGADARTLLTGNIGKVVIYLRYSQRCQAAWAAITEGAPNDYATITSSSGETETALIHWGYDNYSAMVNAADPSATFQVCGHQPAGNDCTAGVSGLAHVVASTPIPIGPASPPASPATPAATPTPAEPTPAATPAPAEPTPAAAGS